jgi:hypothetical protein
VIAEIAIGAERDGRQIGEFRCRGILSWWTLDRYVREELVE